MLDCTALEDEAFGLYESPVNVLAGRGCKIDASEGAIIHGGDDCTVEAGDWSEVTVGNHGIAIVGLFSKAVAGDHGKAVAYGNSSATAGNYGIAISQFGPAVAGDDGIAICAGSAPSEGSATAGERGIAQCPAGAEATVGVGGMVRGGDGAKLIIKGPDGTPDWVGVVGQNGIDPHFFYGYGGIEAPRIKSIEYSHIIEKILNGE